MKKVSHKKLYVRNPDTGKFEPLMAIRGESAYEIAVRLGKFTGTEEEWANFIEIERAAAVKSIEEKGAETLSSIPDDYTELAEQVVGKIDKTSIAQELGDSEEKVLSQKAATEQVNDLRDKSEISWQSGYWNSNNGSLSDTESTEWKCTEKFFSTKVPLISAEYVSNKLLYCMVWDSDTYKGCYNYRDGKWYKGATEIEEPLAFNICGVSTQLPLENVIVDVLSVRACLTKINEVSHVSSRVLAENNMFFNNLKWAIGKCWQLTTSHYITDAAWQCTEKLKLDYIPPYKLNTNKKGYIMTWLNGVLVGYFSFGDGKWYKNASTELSETPVFDTIAFQVMDLSENAIEFETLEKINNGIKGYWVNKKIGFLGDSITAGAYTENDGEGIGNHTTSRPYLVKCCEVLGATPYNYGSSGTSISGTSTVNASGSFVKRYTNMSSDLDMVVVLGGTNDFATHVPLGTKADKTDISFYGALDVLCNGLIDRYPDKQIVFITPLLRNFSTGNETEPNAEGKYVEDFRKAIYEVAQDRYGLMVVNGKSLGISPYNSTWKAQYIYDGLHPNPIGHEKIGETLAHILSAI